MTLMSVEKIVMTMLMKNIGLMQLAKTLSNSSLIPNQPATTLRVVSID